MKVKEIVNFINTFAEESSAYDWDNTGFLVGDYNEKVTGLLICLNVTKEVISEAINNNCNMIISHHPLIYKPLSSVINDEAVSGLVYNLIRNNINLYSAHTSMDLSSKGINNYIANKLNLSNVNYLEKIENREDIGLGAIGKLPNKMNYDEFLLMVKLVFNASKLNVSSNYKTLKHKKIEKVAICLGGGSDLIYRVASLKAQVFITADFKMQDYIRAARKDLLIISPTHFQSEHCFLPVMENNLKPLNVNIVLSEQTDVQEIL